MKRGVGDGGGGGALHCTSFHLSGKQVQRVPAGYARRIEHLHCPTNVSLSFSTFLFLAASWTGVDKKYSDYLSTVFRIHRIHMFLGPPDPDPFVRGMDMDPDPDPDPSVIMQK